MALKVVQLKRKFLVESKGKNIEIDDPNPKLSIEEVKELYTDIYPELINCRGHETKVEGETQVITFTTTFAPKG